MKPKFKIGDKVRIGRPDKGYDIVQILEIDNGGKYPRNPQAINYRMRILTRNVYLKPLSGEIYDFVYPWDDWEMEHAENALQKLKKRYETKV